MPKGIYKRTEETKIALSTASIAGYKDGTKKGFKKGYGTNIGRIFSKSRDTKISEAKKGSKLTEEHKRNSVQARREKSGYIGRKGEKSNLWRGGISSPNELIRKSGEYKLWREAVFARDNWTCVWCYAKNGNGKTIVLNADHIKPFAQYPELRFAIDNGRTLCEPCHRTTDTYGGKTRI